MAKPFVWDPAELNQRISLYEQNFDDAIPWQEALDDALIATVWAGLETIGTSEKNKAGQLMDDQSLQCVIRHRLDLREARFLLYRGQRYDIHSTVDPDQRQRWLILNASKTVGHD